MRAERCAGNWPRHTYAQSGAPAIGHGHGTHTRRAVRRQLATEPYPRLATGRGPGPWRARQRSGHGMQRGALGAGVYGRARSHCLVGSQASVACRDHTHSVCNTLLRFLSLTLSCLPVVPPRAHYPWPAWLHLAPKYIKCSSESCALRCCFSEGFSWGW